MSVHHTQKNLYSQDIFDFWKLPGETLAVMLERFKRAFPDRAHEKMTYAGRLDPMAEGIVPVLVGDARFHKDTLLAAQKTYEVTVLVGVSTDTADMLGIVTTVSESVDYDQTVIAQVIQSLTAIKELAYPMYSSRTVDGTPLFVHARAGRAVVPPTKGVEIAAVEVLQIECRALALCIEEMIPVIERVVGDFRQDEIISTWRRIKETVPESVVTLITLRLSVSSGTYMRTLAEVIGQKLGSVALAYRIVRTNVARK